MLVDEADHRIELTRRNLLALLAKLDGHPPGSACELSKDGWLVKAVEDEVHYSDREPGPLHDDTLRAIADDRQGG